MRTSIVWMLLALVALVGACSDEPAGPVTPNPSLAQAIVDSANDSLGVVMRVALDSILEYGDSTFRPNDLDFTGVNVMYERAVVADPANLDAHFGAGFTELLTVFADPDLNALYERVKRFADTLFLQDGGYFPTAIYPVPIGIMGPDLLPRAFPLTAGGAPSLLPDLPRLDHALRASAAADPQPSDIQAILESVILPRVIDARDTSRSLFRTATTCFGLPPRCRGIRAPIPLSWT